MPDKKYPNDRDCEHGSLKDCCQTCDYEAEIKKLRYENARLLRVNLEWQEVTSPAFEYVDEACIGELGKSKILALIGSHKELAAHVERLRGGLNQSIELLVTALCEPEQITQSEIHDLRTIELSVPGGDNEHGLATQYANQKEG